MTIIKVRKGINGFRYAICNSQGNWIGNASKLSGIHKEYEWEIKHGYIKLVRELRIYPENKEGIEKIGVNHNAASSKTN